MDKQFNQLISIISEWIVNIGEEYFNFPVAGMDYTIQRERVYCSELYYQIRSRIAKINYTVNSEPNKINHPYIEEYCGPIDPDLIIHRPGSMSSEDNLAVIEVKRSTGDLTGGIIKDIETINCMTTIPNGYFGGIIIIYGELTKLIRKNLINRIK